MITLMAMDTLTAMVIEHITIRTIRISMSDAPQAYSHGLESAVAQGLVKRDVDLVAWLRDLVALGSLRTDLIFLSVAWRATSAGDVGSLVAHNHLALAFQPSAERYLETSQQGGSFADTVTAAWAAPAFEAFRAACDGPVAYPVVVGVAAAAHGVPLHETLSAYGLAFVQNAVSAAIRLSLIGQTKGQMIVAQLMPAISTVALAAVDSSLDDLGSATISADLASLEHETLYSRLFRS
jgi:urease accessory protein